MESESWPEIWMKGRRNLLCQAIRLLAFHKRCCTENANEIFPCEVACLSYPFKIPILNIYTSVRRIQHLDATNMYITFK